MLNLEACSRVNPLACSKSCGAADELCHGRICHMATSFSANDLNNQIVLKYPDIMAPSINL